LNISRNLAKKPELNILAWLLVATAAGVIASQSWSVGILFGIIWAALLAITPLTAFFALLVLAPMRTLIETESPVRLPLEIGQITVLVLAGAWLIFRITRQKPLLNFTWSPIYIPLAGFLIAVSATAFSALSMSAWLNEWLKWVMITALVVLVLDFRHWEWLVGGLILAAAGNALVGVYIFLGGSGALHLLINERFFRAFGTFGQPNPFGGFMGLIAPLAVAATLGQLWQLWQNYRQNRNLSGQQVLITSGYAFAAGLICLGVIISWSRGAWLGFGLSMLVFVIAIPRRWWQSILILVIVISVVGLLWASGRLPATIVDRINSATAEIFAFNDVRGVDTTPENFAVVERLAHWQAALDMARSNWWLGVGFGNYEIAYEDYRLIGWKISLGHAHNYYLNVLAETGIIGLSAYLTLWSGIFWLTLRARNHPDMSARLIAVGLLGTWTYLAIHSLTDNLYVNNLFLHLGIMLGITALLYNQTYRHSKIRVL
jgi:putative inorganic carbon (HCO3(-)) transporter